ncbi:MAG: SIMPL domain-containing protein [Ktedonobacterales bacterium]
MALACAVVCAAGVVAQLARRPRRRGRGARGGRRDSGVARGITVTGRGAVSVTPDEAQITAGINVSAASAKDASTRGAEAMQRVIAALKAHGVPDKRIQTGFISIQPEYSHGEQGARKVGYTTSNMVNATITELDRAGALLDALVEAGGDEVVIQGVRVAARDTTGAERQARGAALADARAQAEQIARDLGLTLGPVLSVAQSGMSSGGGPRPMHMARMASYAAATPVEAGEIEVSVQMDVTWGIV